MEGARHRMSGEPIVRLRLTVQWGEMDSYGHVNNTVYFRWFESARMETFRKLGWLEVERDLGIGPILHSTQARFRVPVEWPDEVEVTSAIRDVEADRFTMLYAVHSRAHGRVACEGSGLIVAYDYRRKAKATLPAAIVDAIAALAQAP
jgi:acyl-CoA thioester hydrolase